MSPLTTEAAQRAGHRPDCAGAEADFSVGKAQAVEPWRSVCDRGQNRTRGDSFYDSNGACSDFPVGYTFRALEKYELNRPIKPSNRWPPGDFEQLINVSPILPVPARFDHLD